VVSAFSIAYEAGNLVWGRWLDRAGVFWVMTAGTFANLPVGQPADDPVWQAAQDGGATGSRFLRASSLSIEKEPAPPRMSASRPAI
jgi:hypothetical protein